MGRDSGEETGAIEPLAKADAKAVASLKTVHWSRATVGGSPVLDDDHRLRGEFVAPLQGTWQLFAGAQVVWECSVTLSERPTGPLPSPSSDEGKSALLVLRGLLADQFSDRGSAQRAAVEAGIQRRKVPWADDADTFWWAVIEETAKVEGTDSQWPIIDALWRVVRGGSTPIQTKPLIGGSESREVRLTVLHNGKAVRRLLVFPFKAVKRRGRLLTVFAGAFSLLIALALISLIALVHSVGDAYGSWTIGFLSGALAISGLVLTGWLRIRSRGALATLRDLLVWTVAGLMLTTGSVLGLVVLPACTFEAYRTENRLIFKLRDGRDRCGVPYSRPLAFDERWRSSKALALTLLDASDEDRRCRAVLPHEEVLEFPRSGSSCGGGPDPQRPTHCLSGTPLPRNAHLVAERVGAWPECDTRPQGTERPRLMSSGLTEHGLHLCIRGLPGEAPHIPGLRSSAGDVSLDVPTSALSSGGLHVFLPGAGRQFTFTSGQVTATCSMDRAPQAGRLVFQLVRLTFEGLTAPPSELVLRAGDVTTRLSLVAPSPQYLLWMCTPEGVREAHVETPQVTFGALKVDGFTVTGFRNGEAEWPCGHGADRVERFTVVERRERLRGTVRSWPVRPPPPRRGSGDVFLCAASVDFDDARRLSFASSGVDYEVRRGDHTLRESAPLCFMHGDHTWDTSCANPGRFVRTEMNDPRCGGGYRQCP